jgi:hypothetical protein
MTDPAKLAQKAYAIQVPLQAGQARGLVAKYVSFSGLESPLKTISLFAGRQFC